MSSYDDLSQIGATPDGKIILSYLVDECKFFDTQQTAMKFAMCVAIRFKLTSSSSDEKETGFVSAQHAIGLDKNGQLRELITTLFPNEQKPYYFSQILCDKGLKYIRERISDKPTMVDLLNIIR